MKCETHVPSSSYKGCRCSLPLTYLKEVKYVWQNTVKLSKQLQTAIVLSNKTDQYVTVINVAWGNSSMQVCMQSLLSLDKWGYRPSQPHEKIHTWTHHPVLLIQLYNKGMLKLKQNWENDGLGYYLKIYSTFMLQIRQISAPYRLFTGSLVTKVGWFFLVIGPKLKFVLQVMLELKSQTVFHGGLKLCCPLGYRLRWVCQKKSHGVMKMKRIKC